MNNKKELINLIIRAFGYFETEHDVIHLVPCNVFHFIPTDVVLINYFEVEQPKESLTNPISYLGYTNWGLKKSQLEDLSIEQLQLIVDNL